jgi:hypothetical protein
MKMLQRCLLLPLLMISLFIVSESAFAQAAEGDIVRVETRDRSVLIGTLIRETEERVVIRIDGVGEVTIERDNIRSIQVIPPERIRNGEYWFENPQSTRYFFAPNALPLRKGKGYYQNVWIFFNNVNYGVTDHFSIGAGTVPVFLFGTLSIPIWVLPKFSIPLGDDLYLGAGGLLGGVIGEDSQGFGLLYSTLTYGNRDRNLTAGFGYGYAGTEWSDTPLVNLSGIYRTGRTVYLLGEIYFAPGVEGSGFAIGGLRWSPERFAVDFGLARPLSDAGGIIGVPWLGISIPFGN